jgi:hypothetical protein
VTLGVGFALVAVGDGVTAGMLADVGVAVGLAEASASSLASMRSSRQSTYCFSFCVEFIGAVKLVSQAFAGASADATTEPPTIKTERGSQGQRGPVAAHQENVTVAVAVQTWPEALVPCAMEVL